MASNLRFRVRAPNGSQSVLGALPSSSTIEELQTAIIKTLQLQNVKPACIEIKYVFPPAKVISNTHRNTTLSSLQLTSGNLIISVLDSPSFIEEELEQNKVNKPQAKEEKEQNNNQDGDTLDGTMIVKEIASDNSCLFNAVLFVAEEGTVNKAKSFELREVIASIVMSDPVKYSKALLGKINNEYVGYIMKQDTWGGSIELAILSNYYEIQINAIDVVTLNVHRFGEDSNYKQCVYIIYDGIHYDAMIMKYNTGKTQHRFATSNDSVFAQSLSIAAELNSKKQFTDVYNFGLICNECNTKLIGQKEAQQHAETTKHTQFSQYQ